MSTYAAHITTAEATDLGDPEILVIGESGSEPVARFPLPDDLDPRESLADHGWRMLGTAKQAGTGYYVATVEPA